VLRDSVASPPQPEGARAKASPSGERRATETQPAAAAAGKGARAAASPSGERGARLTRTQGATRAPHASDRGRSQRCAAAGQMARARIELATPRFSVVDRAATAGQGRSCPAKCPCKSPLSAPTVRFTLRRACGGSWTPGGRRAECSETTPKCRGSRDDAAALVGVFGRLDNSHEMELDVWKTRVAIQPTKALVDETSAVSKTVAGLTVRRGFESLPLRFSSSPASSIDDVASQRQGHRHPSSSDCSGVPRRGSGSTRTRPS
jgi:hypothetical protein